MTERAGAYTEWDESHARTLAESLRSLPGACLPILHALQGEFGYIHDGAIPLVADVLNLSKAEVVGVVEFYSDFRRTPPAPHTVKVCLAEACQSIGSSALVERVSSVLATEMGGRSSDGQFDLEPVYCLGNCALSPALVLDGTLHGRVTPDRASSLLAGIRS